MGTPLPPGLTPEQKETITRLSWMVAKLFIVALDLLVLVVICVGVRDGSTAEKVVAFIAVAWMGVQLVSVATSRA